MPSMRWGLGIMSTTKVSELHRSLMGRRASDAASELRELQREAWRYADNLDGDLRARVAAEAQQLKASERDSLATRNLEFAIVDDDEKLPPDNSFDSDSGASSSENALWSLVNARDDQDDDDEDDDDELMDSEDDEMSDSEDDEMSDSEDGESDYTAEHTLESAPEPNYYQDLSVQPRRFPYEMDFEYHEYMLPSRVPTSLLAHDPTKYFPRQVEEYLDQVEEIRATHDRQLARIETTRYGDSSSSSSASSGSSQDSGVIAIEIVYVLPGHGPPLPPRDPMYSEFPLSAYDLARLDRCVSDMKGLSRTLDENFTRVSRYDSAKRKKWYQPRTAEGIIQFLASRGRGSGLRECISADEEWPETEEWGMPVPPKER